MVETNDVNEIKPTDIVFDCPYCSKSLAIDYRGAGLTIPCSDCGQEVQVPIPEGMQVTDIDSTEEEQEARILNLRRTLTQVREQLDRLETQLADESARRAQLEEAQSGYRRRFGQMSANIRVMQKAVEDMAGAVRELSDQVAALGDGRS